MASTQRDETIGALVELRDKLNALPDTVAAKAQLVELLQEVWNGLANGEGFHLPPPAWMSRAGLAVSQSRGQ